MPSWLWEATESRWRRGLLSPLLVAEGLYRVGARVHRLGYVTGALRSHRVPLRVVSIGNLTVGGSAKTPVTAWLARELRARGRKVAVLSRGVGGSRIRSVNVVSDGSRILVGTAEVGDEPVLLAKAARGVPVLAGRNRTALALRARALFGTEVALLDDGFQHYRLARDVDLVCLDAAFGLGNRHVLPRGPLREPPRALRRAHAILWTRAPQGFSAPPTPPGGGSGPQWVVPIEASGLRDLASGRSEPLAHLSGAEVGLLAAVARPDRIVRSLEHLGARVVTRRLFRDHHLYGKENVAGLDSGVTWVTTEKDAVKIPARWLQGRSLLVLEEEVRPADAPRLVQWLLERLDSSRS